jgi:hypothetical protein
MRLSHWYWGQVCRKAAVDRPARSGRPGVCGHLCVVRGHPVPWTHVSLYAALVCALAACFLGLGFLLSSLARSTEVSLGTSLVIWLVLVALLDLLLLSVLMRSQFDPAFVVGVALANPLQTFRTASMILFDPQLIPAGAGLLCDPRSLRRVRLCGLGARLSCGARSAGGSFGILAFQPQRSGVTVIRLRGSLASAGCLHHPTGPRRPRTIASGLLCPGRRLTAGQCLGPAPARWLHHRRAQAGL